MGVSHRKGTRDANEPEIVEALEAHGLKVYLLEQPVDLLVWNPTVDRLFLIEVKNPEHRNKTTGGIRGPKKNLRPLQRELLALGVRDFKICWTPAEALLHCGILTP